MNKLSENRKPDYPKVVAFLCWTVVFIGFLVLLGWATGYHQLASFSRKYLPTSPLAAVMSIFFGGVIIGLQRQANHTQLRHLWLVVTGILTLLGFLIFLRYFDINTYPVEDFLYSLFVTTTEVNINHISPYSGLMFTLVGVSLGINLLFPHQRKFFNLVCLLGFAVSIAGMVDALGYSFGMPFLYGGHKIPLAIPTAIIFFLLGMALIFIGGRNGVILQHFAGHSASAKVLRAILPVVLSAIVLENLLDVYLSDDLMINPALLLTVLTVTFTVLTILVVIRLTRNIFRDAEKAEREMELQKSLFQQLFENSPIGMALLDKDEKVLAINGTFEEVFQYSIAEVNGRTIFDLVVPAEKMEESLLLKSMINEGQKTNIETVRKRKDGVLVPVHFFGVPITRNDEKAGMYAIYIDVTDRKQAEETLRESEERYRSVFMNSTVGIYRTSPQGEILMANPALVDMLGYSSLDELKKRDLKNDYFETGFQRNDFIRHIEKENEIRGVESAWKRADNTILHIKESARVFRDQEGQVQYYEGMVEDVTERRQREVELQVQFEIGHSVATTTNLTELMAQIHRSLKKVVYAENCFFALYNEKTGMFEFPYFVDQFDTAPSPLDLSKSCTAHVFHSGNPMILSPQLFQQLKDREAVELVGSAAPSWIGIPLQIASRTIGVLVLQHYQEENVFKENDLLFLDSIGSQIANVIERRRAMEALQKSEAELRESNAAKDKFFSIISHDLKSPFNSILGFSNILADQVREKNLDGIEIFAEIIQNSSQRAMDLLENLLDWSRTQTGRIEFHPERCEIAPLILESIDILSDTALQKSITITKEKVSEAVVVADKAMIGAVLRNLISNAIKFTNPGGTINIAAEHDATELVISVTDNGVGIQADALEKIFRIEEGYSTKGTQNEQGTGLGLILCKEFVEKHGGNIRVESEVGQGSKFSFTIPYKTV